MFRPGVVILGAVLVTAIACGGSPTSPTANVAITLAGTGVTTYTYTRDIQPLLASDCVTCHGNTLREGGFNFTTYSGVLAALTAGSENSKLVKAVQPTGPMFVNLSGNRTAKSQMIYDWVVSSKAAQ